MSEYKGIEFLRNKLAQKRGRIDLRYRFYEMKYLAKDMEISTPPKLRGWMSSFGWCGKAVDSLADRLVLRGFENDTYGMSDIYLMNNLDVLADSAVLGALICACSFIYISQDDSGFPQMRAVDGRDATGVIDPITNMLTEGYAVLESDKMTGRPKTECYPMQRLVVVLSNATHRWEEQRKECHGIHTRQDSLPGHLESDHPQWSIQDSCHSSLGKCNSGLPTRATITIISSYSFICH